MRSHNYYNYNQTLSDLPLQEQIKKFQEKSYSEFNIFNYIDENTFFRFEPKHQLALSNFLKSAIELRKNVSASNHFYGNCIVCTGSTKNFICRNCVMDMML